MLRPIRFATLALMMGAGMTAFSGITAPAADVDRAAANLASAQALIAAAESEDVDAMIALYGDEPVFIQPFSPRDPDAQFVGVDAVSALFSQIFASIEPLVFVEETYTVSQDGRIVFIEAQGDMAVAQTGADYNNRYVFRLDFDETGKIARITEYYNSLYLARAFGGL